MSGHEYGDEFDRAPNPDKLAEPGTKGDRLRDLSYEQQATFASFDELRSEVYSRLAEIKEAAGKNTGSLFYTYGFDESSLQAERYDGDNTFSGGAHRDVLFKSSTPDNAPEDTYPNLYIVANDTYPIKNEEGIACRAIMSRKVLITDYDEIYFNIGGDVVSDGEGLLEPHPKTLVVEKDSTDASVTTLDWIYDVEGRKDFYARPVNIDKSIDPEFQALMHSERVRSKLSDAWMFSWRMMYETAGRTPEFTSG